MTSLTREDCARIANKAFGKHPECEAGTEEFLSILNRLPGGSGAGGEPTAPGSDPSNGGASLSIDLASFCQPKDAVPSPTVASATCSERPNPPAVP